MTCSGRTKQGKPCAARPLRGQSFCIMHSSPTIAAQLGRMGAQQRRRPAGDITEFPPPANAEMLRQLLSLTITEVRRGALDCKTGNAVAVLASVLLRAFDASNFAERLSAIEGLLQGGARKRVWTT